MNTELMLRIADAIEAQPDAFYMGSWYDVDEEYGCGTTRCIGGWAVHLTNPRHARRLVNDINANWEDEARDLLELDSAEAYRLFFDHATAWWSEALLKLGYLDALDDEDDEVSAERAASVLRAIVSGELSLSTTPE